MATKIEDIYDALVTVISGQLPDYQRFPNPYEIDANTFLRQSQGYGIAIGSGTDTERYVGCLVTWARNFSVTLVRKITTTENNTSARVNLEKDILVDHDLLRKAIYNNSTLGGIAIKSTVTDDGGVFFIDGDRLKFLSIELNLLVEYQESPT